MKTPKTQRNERSNERTNEGAKPGEADLRQGRGRKGRPTWQRTWGESEAAYRNYLIDIYILRGGVRGGEGEMSARTGGRRMTGSAGTAMHVVLQGDS